jgi:hypothetical protein
MVASNTKDCFRECIGKRVKGVLFDAMPIGRLDLARGTKSLIFDDGTALTIGGNGSFWIDGVEEVNRAILIRRKELEDTKAEISEVLIAAGEKT